MSKDKNETTSQEFDGTGLSSGEKRQGTIRFKEYQEKYHIDNISDSQLLSELVFREMLQIRTKKQIATFSKSDTTASDTPKIPTMFLKALDENLQYIITLKKELGLLKEEKEQSFFDYIKQLKEKFKIWRDENEGSRQITCPFCSKIFYLMIRTDKYEAVKGGFFKDKILCNEHLIKLYKEKVISKLDCANILGTSEDYIEWLISKWYQNEN